MKAGAGGYGVVALIEKERENKRIRQGTESCRENDSNHKRNVT